MGGPPFGYRLYYCPVSNATLPWLRKNGNRTRSSCKRYLSIGVSDKGRRPQLQG